MDLTKLKAAVERDRTVNESVITLLGQLAQLARDAVNNAPDLEAAQAEINALADQMDAQQDALAAAATANTPATETPTEPVDPNAPTA
jgi:ABC-type transporter Mla subunit MlaD